MADKLTLEARAKLIAAEANKCCSRSDGYEEAIEALVLKHLNEASEEASEDGWEAGAMAASD